MQVLDEDRVRALLRYEDLIPAIERALVDYSAGRVQAPPRQMLEVQPAGGFFAPMTAIAPFGMGVKLVSFFPHNTGVPTHHALIALFRAETGEPLAVMDGRLITEMRTAAASAVATKALARRDARVLAVMGTGVQAHAHLDAMPHARDFQEVRVWGRDPAKARHLAAQFGAVAVEDAEEAVRGADVVVTATSATEPVLKGAWLGPASHVNAVGWRGPKGRELDDEAMLGAFVVADSRANVMNESGDVLIAGATVGAEIGEILAGTKAAPAGRRTVFESVGLSVEDVAVAALVVSKLG
ncbi:ornithine cyclodeaminase family protein [Falsiroseomonas sp. HW251]|uniref:ornithine cyclodeaminase family protein n=1 Tax=Falsiroseomonas sp. HW251 TaxID=3390998 RepID=UPI003D31A41B